MPRVIQPIEIDEQGSETHPAFGMISAVRTMSSHGATLFDSEIKHRQYITVKIQTATRRRDLNHDWIHSERNVVEINLSEAQWAAFVSSMNSSGVPCTLGRVGNEMDRPEMPYEPRLQQSFDYAHEAAAGMFDRAKAALDAVEEKPTKANIRALRTILDNSAPNVDYATKTVAEHVENTVVKARADIEAMVAQHADHLALEPGSYTAPLMLDAGESDGD